MKKTFKKMLSLVLVLAMVLAMGITAFAEGEGYTITINKDAKDKADIHMEPIRFLKAIFL